MLEILPPGELSQVKEAASYIACFPPLEQWENFKQIQAIDPKAAAYIQLLFRWLGRSLNAFSDDASNPLPDSELSETMQKIVQQKVNKYLLLSMMIFQGEGFLRAESKAAGIEYPFTKRSDLLKHLAFEECGYEIALSLQTHWESHSEQQRNERLRDCQKFLHGEISYALYQREVERWERQDAKLHRDPSLLEHLPWTRFCLYVFYKYRVQIPAFESFANTQLGAPKGNHGKFAIINGVTRATPKRGKSKQKS